MARSETEERPVSEEEFERFPSRVEAHFDRIRKHLKERID